MLSQSREYASRSDPEGVLPIVRQRLSEAGLPGIQTSVLSTSYATGGTARSTIASLADGVLPVGPTPSLDSTAWTHAVNDRVWPVVRTVNSMLKRTFPSDYLPPAGFGDPAAAASSPDVSLLTPGPA